MAGTVLAAVPTPFAADGTLDLACARRLFGFVAGHADGLFVAGTTGEFPSLDDGERLSLVEAALEAAGPDRVIAHIGAPDSYRAARLARQAVSLGITRIAAITPFYLAPSPAEVTDYYRRIREAAPAAGLYAYIFPERTGLAVAPPQFCELADAVGLAGAKFSGRAARNVAACAAERPALRIFSGDDSDLGATLRTGGAGIISARCAAFPEVFAALAAALAAGDSAAAAARQSDVAAIAALGASIGRVKEALRLRGFGPMAARMPVAEPDETTAARIAELVKVLAPAP
ncbi:MAG TPA: dihydrodipicolinate synthase family protein [Trebonia sp.]|nr:dihydrodipicolinate synthase family protein [Trebonia sp.]